MPALWLATQSSKVVLSILSTPTKVPIDMHRVSQVKIFQKNVVLVNIFDPAWIPSGSSVAVQSPYKAGT